MGRIAAFVPEFVVKDLPLDRTHVYIYIYMKTFTRLGLGYGTSDKW